MRRLGYASLVGFGLVLACTSKCSDTPPEQPPGISGVVSSASAPTGDTEGGGARVCASRPLPAHVLVKEQLEPVCTTTDAEGHYALRLSPGIYSVVADREKCIPRGELVVVRAGSSVRLDLDLTPGGRAFTGQVVDSKGAPVADARIEA